MRQIEDRLGVRRLIFFGSRGMDAQPLLAISQFERAVCLSAALDSPSVEEFCLESHTRRRVDLDCFDIDSEQSESVDALRAFLRSAIDTSAVILPYRPCALLTAAWYPRMERVRYLGMFHDFQYALEHKPWVETSLLAAGIPVLPWRYYHDEDVALIAEATTQGPIVVRASRSNGGARISIVTDSDDLVSSWPVHSDGFVAVAPYLVPSIPLNVTGCVFPDGQITLHAPSLQLIGIEGATDRTLGYCGNDFGAVANLEPVHLDQLETIARGVGRWLYQRGFVGAFGVDGLLHNGSVSLVELNPRLQGSTPTACRLAYEMDRPDVLLDHLAAHIGLPAPPPMPLREQARAQERRSRIICHNLETQPVRLQPEFPPEFEGWVDLVAPPDVEIAPHAAICAIHIADQVTPDGTRLLKSVGLIMEDVLLHLRNRPIPRRQ